LALFLLSNFSVYSRYFFAHDVYATNTKAAASSTGPTFKDPNLRAELVAEGLSYPTSMAFINNNNNGNDILVLQKNNGEVRLVSNGILKDQPVLKVDIDNSTRICCRGLLGIATKINNNNNNNNTEVFLYLSEAAKDDQPVRNRVYKYQWNGQTLLNAKLILDLPAEGLNHPGGKLAIGPDQYLYAVIGDLNRQGKLQNFIGGPGPDDTSVILRVNPDNGYPAKNNPFLSEKNGNGSAMSRYFAYGIRNGFGLAFDPVSGTLWDAENGDKDYDEINVVDPGFNSGWKKVMGPISRNSDVAESQLFIFPGSRYADPVFSWFESIGVTDIAFLNSSELGDKYKNNIFVGDITKGNLYYFEVNENRTGLKFDNNDNTGSSPSSGLLDKVADNKNEVAAVTLATGFRGITDIKTGPDGLLYILTFDEKSHGAGKIYRISASSSNNAGGLAAAEAASAANGNTALLNDNSRSDK
ncbi:MAG: PQQ-dependent sugar dehydrogenase, partial [Nitrososphaeraceae archaeon]